ncbi:MAG TPA: prolyl oligopeptidase family serine peptidase [Candidatus Cybelea sp.]|nr:prolyl oligopeptidase family serine peptidase [Candidatus Cybelea sp.]
MTTGTDSFDRRSSRNLGRPSPAPISLPSAQGAHQAPGATRRGETAIATWPVALAATIAAVSTAPVLRAQMNLKYQQPPKAIVQLVDTRPTPEVEVSPTAVAGKRWMLIEFLSGMPTIADLAQPELRLAGLRFNPKTNGPSRGRYATSLKLKPLEDTLGSKGSSGGEEAISGLPAEAKITSPSWSPDGRRIAFVNATDKPTDAGLSLWIVDVATARAERVPGVALNGVFGRPCEWRSDSKSLVCKTVPKHRGEAPHLSEVPAGPVVDQNLGRVTPAATYEDLLKTPADERIFDYYATVQVEIVRLAGATAPVGKPGVIVTASASPDAHYVLIDELHHPYSYTLPFEMFPERVSVVNVQNGRVKQLVDKPLEDNIPNIHDATSAGPREYDWRSDAPATLSWVEALDGGDARKEVMIRDAVYTLDAPFSGSPRKLADLRLRFHSLAWGDGGIALIDERRWKDRKRILVGVSRASAPSGITLFEGSFEDRYRDPGEPMEVMNGSGKLMSEMTPDQRGIYFWGRGASPDGDRPFLSRLDVASGERRTLWQSAPPYFELPVSVLDPAGPTLLLRRESPEQSPNYYVKNVERGTLASVTAFPSPYGNTPVPKKRILKYKRVDGVELSANLYLPPGYKPEDGPLPTLIEAYPTEYKTKAAAGEMSGSPYQFPMLTWGSPVPFVTQGYAVLENATIPIIGEGKAEPNDTYVEQLVAGAKAAINEGVKLGVVDPNRVAVMGHSYGAFMTANLLAHSDLFKAGIARSGAYNRSLTPFGFQNEERTYWQAPEVYYKMSPFSYADKIKTPLLLIHGLADNNSGTFTIQSERLFSAIKGNGGTVRLVLLPLEAHGYAARESVLHMFWEMNEWLNTYVKSPAAATTAASR